MKAYPFPKPSALAFGILLVLASGFTSPLLHASSGLNLTTVGKLTIDGKKSYSGITWIGGNTYAIVSDKTDGYYLSTITLSPTGAPTGWSQGSLIDTGIKSNDNEGIAYVPATNTVFISGEENTRIREHNLTNGVPTGCELGVPTVFNKMYGNYGFESLDYSTYTNRFWTTSESALKGDNKNDAGPASATNSVENLLRLQSFDGKTLAAAGQFAYKMDVPKNTGSTYKYAFGVPDIVALPDGKLLVMEREFFVPDTIFASEVICKIYVVDPTDAFDVSDVESLSGLANEVFLQKELLWSQRMGLFSSIANYEGMCLGPQLEDGSFTLLMINDSQEGHTEAGGWYSLKEYVQVLRLDGVIIPVPEVATWGILLGATLFAFAIVTHKRRSK